jgi:SPP1 family predicted phage head-tail adaptor
MPSCGSNVVSQMNKRVTIQTETQISDGQGGQTASWVSGATVWAKIEPVKAWERMQAMQLQAPVTHKIIIRYRSDVTSRSRFLYGSRVLDIVEVINPMEANQFLEIKAIERTQA